MPGVTAVSSALSVLALLCTLPCRGAAPPFENIFKVTNNDEFRSWIVEKRRYIHQRPETMYEEFGTSEFIQSTLRDLGVPFTTGWGKNVHGDPSVNGTGVVAHIGSGNPPCVALRADIDALPILEDTGLPFASQTPGKMHACGHDSHTSMLLGAARYLKELNDREPLKGTVRLIFQPAEEGGAGAKMMREEGVLSLHPPVQRIFGIHVWPNHPTGTINSNPGTIMAGASEFFITIRGRGGHAAMPHLNVDPVPAAAALISAFQTVVSREISPLDSRVISITTLKGGHATNVIPSEVVLGGTHRALTQEAMESTKQRIIEMSESMAGVYGCSAGVEFTRNPYPPTVNDPELFKLLQKVGGAASTKGKVNEIEPTMGGEDFSFFQESVPGLFVFIGQGSGLESMGRPTTAALHNPQFTLDEAVLPRGSALHSLLALASLDELSTSSSGSTTSSTTSMRSEDL
uniref:Peptidase M20 dimerisation domain-containing protein n=1 Tax=Chromera velia CCMP2878 TaxID=1169474 RepID=A0A0G4FQ88_9ALVE|eukprot:Cvel_18233.t1-p1 / transcript=Cvel_18233.t1 / gene=Cvel_18233 / organism=Chromera_velia_CCMP2878 / gene_product=IAA-amino acid hydrolase ILR1-like 8, putative / transcript_product=IAA-amino acid hydrolase ILR1-like 8, putative / location=Cvel_scaffold1499:1798-5933(-) / protein_length=459 / sequence_SO=supercontig / SO=protein_coding / is_pseudo=false